MGFIRETPKRHSVGVLCVISADPNALLPVMPCVPELETGVLISQSIYIVLVECPFENVNKIPILSLPTPSADNPSGGLLVRITSTTRQRCSLITINYRELTSYVIEEIWKYSSKVRTLRAHRRNNKYVEMYVTLRAAVR